MFSASPPDVRQWLCRAKNGPIAFRALPLVRALPFDLLGQRPYQGHSPNFKVLSTAGQSRRPTSGGEAETRTFEAKLVQSQSQLPPARSKPIRRPDVIYYPTPDETVAEMLRLANIKPGDVLYDLGSGDGRIPIAAAKQYGIRAVGIEIDPKLVGIAQERAQAAEVSDLVTFTNADMFRANIREASVVTLYLSNKINLLLRPKLLRELRPGTRIVSHDFHMGDWQPEQTVRVPWKGDLYRTIYLWTVPTNRKKQRARKVDLSQSPPASAGCLRL